MLLHSGERPRESSIILDLFQFFLFSNVNLPPCLNAHRIVNKFGNCLNLKRKKNSNNKTQTQEAWNTHYTRKQSLRSAHRARKATKLIPFGFPPPFFLSPNRKIKQRAIHVHAVRPPSLPDAGSRSFEGER